MKISLNKIVPESIADNQPTAQPLITPATFEHGLITPATFEHGLTHPVEFLSNSSQTVESTVPQPTANNSSPTQTDATNNLIRPAIFVTDSAKTSIPTAPNSTVNDNTATTGSTCTPAPQSKIIKAFVPCVNSDQRKKLLGFPLNDSGNAERFFELYGDIIKYVCNAKKFFIWNGKYWQADDKKTINFLCEMAMRTYFFVAQALEPLDADLFLHARASCNAGKINALASILQHHCAVDSRDFDAHPHLLNVRNGIVNLQTGELMPHNKAVLLSKYIDINFIPERASSYSNFQDFLHSISCGNNNFISDLQLIFGYGITGETREQVLFLLHGTGSNGKTTLLEAIRNVVSPFVKTFPIAQLVSGTSSSGTRANPALAAASDARILLCSESNESDTLNEGKVKALTGSGTLTTRDLNKSNFEFVPKFKIFLDTNFLPKIKGTDFAIWRRIKVLKFQATFTPDTVDVKLPEKLRSEYEQEVILSWLIAGAAKYYSYGLVLSEDVSQATAEYQNRCDTVGRFLSECIEKQEGASCGAHELYNFYEHFCTELGLDAISSTMFGRAITIRGVKKKRLAHGKVYIDIRLKR